MSNIDNKDILQDNILEEQWERIQSNKDDFLSNIEKHSIRREFEESYSNIDSKFQEEKKSLSTLNHIKSDILRLRVMMNHEAVENDFNQVLESRWIEIEDEFIKNLVEGIYNHLWNDIIDRFQNINQDALIFIYNNIDVFDNDDIWYYEDLKDDYGFLKMIHCDQAIIKSIIESGDFQDFTDEQKLFLYEIISIDKVNLKWLHIIIESNNFQKLIYNTSMEPEDKYLRMILLLARKSLNWFQIQDIIDSWELNDISTNTIDKRWRELDIIFTFMSSTGMDFKTALTIENSDNYELFYREYQNILNDIYEYKKYTIRDDIHILHDIIHSNQNIEDKNLAQERLESIWVFLSHIWESEKSLEIKNNLIYYQKLFKNSYVVDEFKKIESLSSNREKIAYIASMFQNRFTVDIDTAIKNNLDIWIVENKDDQDVLVQLTSLYQLLITRSRVEDNDFIWVSLWGWGGNAPIHLAHLEMIEQQGINDENIVLVWSSAGSLIAVMYAIAKTFQPQLTAKEIYTKYYPKDLEDGNEQWLSKMISFEKSFDKIIQDSGWNKNIEDLKFSDLDLPVLINFRTENDEYGIAWWEMLIKPFLIASTNYSFQDINIENESIWTISDMTRKTDLIPDVWWYINNSNPFKLLSYMWINRDNTYISWILWWKWTHERVYQDSEYWWVYINGGLRWAMKYSKAENDKRFYWRLAQ